MKGRKGGKKEGRKDAVSAGGRKEGKDHKIKKKR